MSMTILTILQICAVFTAYMVVTCAMPLVIINRLNAGLHWPEKLMLSVIFGNFYIINEVFVLQLLHISNRFTLLVGTVLPFAAAVIRVYGIPVKEKALRALHTLKKLLKGELGQKSFVLHTKKSGAAWIGRLWKSFWRCIGKNLLDVLLFLGSSILVLWIYMPNVVQNLGYKAFDIPVHNYWINALGQGKLFVAGVYPFGFHCTIYYLHAIFGIETYVLLRVFSLVQTLMIHWMLLLFLKAGLKSGFLAYLGMAVFAAGDLFERSTYSRFNASLPQEFGMIFILPAVYFGFAYFKTRKKWCLAGFAMSFSLTLAVHFYGTMIAGVFCVAMAIGFFFRFFQKKYFVPIVVTCLISVATAVAPMAIAYATGTPLQGSLGWGLNIINGSSAEDSSEEEETSVSELTEPESSAAESFGVSGEAVDMTAGETTEEYTETDSRSDAVGKMEAILSQCKQKFIAVGKIISQYLQWNVSKYDNSYFIAAVFGGIGLCLLLAIVYLLLREFDQAGRLATVGWFMVFMSILLIAGELGLPRLMDSSRLSIYYAYMLPVLWCFALDGVIALPGMLLHRRWMYQIASFAAMILVSVFFVRANLVKTPYQGTAIETNDAITCLTNIIREHEDWTWTICSANDELRMAEDYGYHYETITFLREIENIGRYAGVTIPTKYTYFFVEKIPIEYYITYEGQGQSISEEGAEMALPTGSGISSYEGESRWIVMSRMYYWAEAFRKMYPENMTVYYESDDFICYQLEQNPDHLFELGIDYGYNNFYQ